MSKSGKLVCSNHNEASGENNKETNIPTYKIELAGNPNSCLIKINKKYHALLDSGAEAH